MDNMLILFHKRMSKILHNFDNIKIMGDNNDIIFHLMLKPVLSFIHLYLPLILVYFNLMYLLSKFKVKILKIHSRTESLSGLCID